MMPDFDFTFGQRDRALDFMAERTGLGREDLAFDMQTFAAIETATDTIRAVIGVNAVYDRQCRLHIATDGSKRWFRRDGCRQLFHFLFMVLKVQRINCFVSVANRDLQILCIKLGFLPEATIACGAHDGSDAILFRMLWTECHWVEV
jgi:RimJ/RimL family protein N-acetyltransferase